MKKIILSSALLLFTSLAFAQEYCDKNTTHDYNEVKEFKNEFTLTLYVDTLIFGDKKYVVGFSKSATFAEESPLIKINDSIAFKVSVAKVVVNGEKKYLCSYSFYKKKICWDNFTSGGSWNTFKPGNSVLSAYSVGTKGNSDYFKWVGNIVIK